MATTQQSVGIRTPLQDTLAQVVRRLRLARWIRLAAQGALIATCFALLFVGMTHWGLLPPWLPLEITLPLLFVFGIGLGTFFAVARPVDSFAAARDVEVRLDLKERLSSALEFENSGPPSLDADAALLRRLQGEDAAAHARALHPAIAFPLRLPWEAKALLPTFLLLLLALVLPALPMFVPPNARAERLIVRTSGEDLARAARIVEKQANTQDLPATRRAARDMQQLGRRMVQGRMDKKQAMVQMARLRRQMADQQRRLAQTGDGARRDDKDLAQAGQEFTQSLATPPPGSAPPLGGKAGKSGATSGPARSPQSAPTSSGTGGNPELQKVAQAMMRGDAHDLSAQLRALAQRVSSRSMSPVEQQRMAQQLQKLSEALKGTPLSEAQKHVQPAADAMTHGDSPRAAGELRQAADATDRQTKAQQDAQGVQGAQQALQDTQEKMAQGSAPPADGHGASGQATAPERPGAGAQPASNPQPSGGSAPTVHPSQGSGQSGGADKNGGAAQPGAQSAGRQGGASGGSARASGGVPGAVKNGSAVSPHSQSLPKAPHLLDARFDPTKNPKYGKIYLGAGNGSSGGGKLLSTKPGVQTPGVAPATSVPYYDTLAPARKSAETAMDKEDIPPAYRSSIRRYFDSLQPPTVRTSK